MSLVGRPPSEVAVQPASDLTEKAEVLQVDAVGLICPLPILRLKKRTAGLPSGTTVDFLTDDPSGRRDLNSLCEIAGHEMLSIEEEGAGVLRYRIRLV